MFINTWMVGNVFFSGVLLIPGILPADLPSHSYRNLKALGAGCSIIFIRGVKYCPGCGMILICSTK